MKSFPAFASALVFGIATFGVLAPSFANGGAPALAERARAELAVQRIRAITARSEARHRTLRSNVLRIRRGIRQQGQFFRRLTELIDRPDLSERQYDEDQAALASELAAVFRTRDVADWLEHFGDADVCVGPVWTRDEASDVFGSRESPVEVPLGAHTELWRRELGVDEA